MKQIFKKIGNGFLTGVGFSIALVIALYSVEYLFPDADVTDSVSGDYHGLDIIDLKENRENDGIKLIGKVKNNTNRTWTNISVEVYFFDDSGEFIDTFSDYVGGLLLPDTELYFNIRCSWGEKYLEGYDNYKILVSYASVVDQ